MAYAFSNETEISTLDGLEGQYIITDNQYGRLPERQLGFLFSREPELRTALWNTKKKSLRSFVLSKQTLQHLRH